LHDRLENRQRSEPGARAGAQHVGRQLLADRSLGERGHIQQHVDVHAGRDAHVVEHRHDFLGGDVAGGARRVRATAEAADGRIDGTWSNDKKTFPFVLNVKETHGTAGALTFVVADLKRSKEFHDIYEGDLILLDRRKAPRLYPLEHPFAFEVSKDACEPGDSLLGNAQYLATWGVDPQKLQSSYKKSFPQEHVLAFDVRFDGCKAPKGRVLALFVVERSGDQLGANIYHLAAGENEITASTKGKEEKVLYATAPPPPAPEPVPAGCLDTNGEAKGALVGKVVKDIDGSGNYFLELDTAVCVHSTSTSTGVKEAVLSTSDASKGDDAAFEKWVGKRIKASGTFDEIMGNKYTAPLEIQVDTIEPAK